MRSSSSRIARGRLSHLVGCLLLILVASLRNARLEVADSLLRERLVALRFGQPAAIVGLVALQLQQPRSLYVALTHELLVDFQLLRRELGGSRRRLDLLGQRRTCERASRCLRLERGDLLV